MPSTTALRLPTTHRRGKGASRGGPFRRGRRVSRSSLRSPAVRRLATVLLCVAAPADAATDERPAQRGAGRQEVGPYTRILDEFPPTGREVGRAALEAPAVQEVRRPNFSGWWTLDRDATTLTPPAFSGGRGGADIDRLFITHAANDNVIVGPETNGLKAWSYTPGREGTIPVGRDTTMRAAARWDGASLVAEGTQGDMRMHEVMRLGADGSRLTIEVTTATPEGVTENTLVYRKDVPVGACGTWAMPCRDFTDRQR